MERPNIEEIEKRLKRGTGYRRMQGTALQLILWIKHLEEQHQEDMVTKSSCGNLIGEQRTELEELRAIGEEFIERRDKGEIRSTYTYNRFKKALAYAVFWKENLKKEEEYSGHICGRAGFVFGNDVCPACEKRDNHKWKE